MFTRFFNWLDSRRDKKLQRQLQFLQAKKQLTNEPLNKALDALTKHTELMQTWLTGFQNLSQQAPFTSTVREEDELLEEQLRKKSKNLDNLIPEWQAEQFVLSNIMDN